MSQSPFFSVDAKGKAKCGNIVTHSRGFLSTCIQKDASTLCPLALNSDIFSITKKKSVF